jgi:hypothetical protein
MSAVEFHLVDTSMINLWFGKLKFWFCLLKSQQLHYFCEKMPQFSWSCLKVWKVCRSSEPSGLLYSAYVCNTWYAVIILLLWICSIIRD